MIFKVNSILPNTNTFNRVFSAKNIKTAAKTMGLALAATTMLTTASCNKKSEPNTTDSAYIESGKFLLDEYCKTSSRRVLHYGNKVGRIVDLDDYDWAETIYPDGSSVRDSAGLKIYITPNGERTVEEVVTDRFNNKITTKNLPDGKKLVRKDFYLKDTQEVLYTEKMYNTKDILISDKYYNKILSDKSKNKFKEEEMLEIFNDNGILLKWITNKDITKSDTVSRYDELGRIIYDFEKNEYYSYKKNNTQPYKSYQMYKGCTRITEYNDKDTIPKIYFVASDGTITE